MVCWAYLATSHNKNLLVLHLPREDQRASAFDLWELFRHINDFVQCDEEFR